MRDFGLPPSNDDLAALARGTLDALPEAFLRHLGQVTIAVEDFADEATLAEMDIEDPFELTGIYEGVPIGEKHADHHTTLPDRIRLFRRPILDEWAEGANSLERLVAHVLVHEIGHHFGLSDEDMHALEEGVA